MEVKRKISERAGQVVWAGADNQTDRKHQGKYRMEKHDITFRHIINNFVECADDVVHYNLSYLAGVHSRAVRVLVLLTVPGHLLFTYTVFYMKAGHTSSTVFFQCFYLNAALLQVSWGAVVFTLGRDVGGCCMLRAVAVVFKLGSVHHD